MSRLADVLLSTEPTQRARLAQVGPALLLLAAGLVGMGYFAAVGIARVDAVLWWGALTVLGLAAIYALVRSGWSSRLQEPAMVTAQLVWAVACAAMAYALLGPARGAVLPVVMLILMFGMFGASVPRMRWICVYTVAVFAIAIASGALRRPAVYAPAVEFGHFLLLATMVPGVAILSARLARLRQRARHQRGELTQTLARMREQTTRDELTGLINRRHMTELMDQEHQRCIRSGQTFCLAMLDIDRFKPVNEAHGYAVGDAVLRAVADEAQRHVRVCDTLARWGGEEFVLMLSDTRAALARGGIERLHQRVAALRILHGGVALGVTLSGGLSEHHAGETVAQTLERAERALGEAKALGCGKIVVAP
ncbi:MAG: GGDEF domain-containing protein [Burkholderiales bacterium]|nr:GGDEF domain-containing protein [Burkholderiales bacterium]